jgi:hypothetical protein
LKDQREINVKATRGCQVNSKQESPMSTETAKNAKREVENTKSTECENISLEDSNIARNKGPTSRNRGVPHVKSV